MLGGRSWESWIAEYSQSHQHPLNQLTHTLDTDHHGVAAGDCGGNRVASAAVVGIGVLLFRVGVAVRGARD
jgi:hypothetical protein